MKSLYERENLQRGDIILCNGQERIFLAYIEGATEPYICVFNLYEESFRNNGSFATTKWKEESVSAKPKEWYEDIPEDGVLCWVSDYNEDVRQRARLITAVCKNNYSKFISNNGVIWRYATPVKPEECWTPKS